MTCLRTWEWAGRQRVRLSKARPRHYPYRHLEEPRNREPVLRVNAIYSGCFTAPSDTLRIS
jgi:hypothetical protein